MMRDAIGVGALSAPGRWCPLLGQWYPVSTDPFGAVASGIAALATVSAIITVVRYITTL